MNAKIGANLNYSLIPFSKKTIKLISLNKLNSFSLLNAGDDYELIFTASEKFSNKIYNLANNNNIKITNIGRIIDKKGIFINNKKIKDINGSYNYLF